MKKNFLGAFSVGNLIKVYVTFVKDSGIHILHTLCMIEYINIYIYIYLIIKLRKKLKNYQYFVCM